MAAHHQILQPGISFSNLTLPWIIKVVNDDAIHDWCTNLPYYMCSPTTWMYATFLLYICVVLNVPHYTMLVCNDEKENSFKTTLCIAFFGMQGKVRRTIVTRFTVNSGGYSNKNTESRLDHQFLNHIPYIRIQPLQQNTP